MRPRTLQEVVRRAAGDGAWEHHSREFLDAFYACDDDRCAQSAMIEGEPALLGTAIADAFIGGMGEHLARRWTLALPAWVRQPVRYLAEPVFVPSDPALRPFLMVTSPVAFRTRLIFTGPDPLQRARFPYAGGTVDFPSECPARGAVRPPAP